MDWLRWYRGSCTDPKFTVIARKSGQPRVAVLAVWALMLETALQSTPRGHLDSWDHDDAGAALDMDGDAVASIYEAMEERGLVNDGLLVAWSERQYDKSSSTQRVALHREKEKQKKQAEADETVETVGNAVKRDETLCNAPETETEADTDTEQKGREGAVALPPAKVRSIGHDMSLWQLDEQAHEEIIAHGHDPGQVIEAVHDWAVNVKPPGKRFKKDPHAFLRNWCRKEAPANRGITNGFVKDPANSARQPRDPFIDELGHAVAAAYRKAGVSG